GRPVTHVNTSSTRRVREVLSFTRPCLVDAVYDILRAGFAGEQRADCRLHLVTDRWRPVLVEVELEPGASGQGLQDRAQGLVVHHVLATEHHRDDVAGVDHPLVVLVDEADELQGLLGSVGTDGEAVATTEDLGDRTLTALDSRE